MSQQDRIEERLRDRVVKARKEAGLSQAELGDALGLSKAGYGHYERGVVSFTVSQVFDLSRILQRRIEWLLGLESDLAEDEERLLGAYRSMGEEKKGTALFLVEQLAHKEN